jgi:hypothetical protein
MASESSPSSYSTTTDEQELTYYILMLSTVQTLYSMIAASMGMVSPLAMKRILCFAYGYIDTALMSTEMLESFDLPMTRGGIEIGCDGVKPIQGFDEYETLQVLTTSHAYKTIDWNNAAGAYLITLSTRSNAHSFASNAPVRFSREYMKKTPDYVQQKVHGAPHLPNILDLLKANDPDGILDDVTSLTVDTRCAGATKTPSEGPLDALLEMDALCRFKFHDMDTLSDAITRTSIVVAEPNPKTVITAESLVEADDTVNSVDDLTQQENLSSLSLETNKPNIVQEMLISKINELHGPLASNKTNRKRKTKKNKKTKNKKKTTKNKMKKRKKLSSTSSSSSSKKKRRRQQ